MADIRAGVPGDAQSLTEIANEAKRHWNYPEAWMQMWQRDLTVSARYILDNPVYIAEGEGAPVGFVALDLHPGREEVDHLWVLPRWMGKGIGRRLMEHALAHCDTEGVESLRVVSDPHAKEFYRGMGAVYDGEFPSSPSPRTIPVLRFDINKSGSRR